MLLLVTNYWIGVPDFFKKNNDKKITNPNIYYSGALFEVI